MRKLLKSTKALLVAGFVLAAMFSFTACAQETEPYISKHGNVTHSSNFDSASIRLTLTNPTNEHWEIVVKVSATWTWKNGERTATGGNEEAFRLAPKKAEATSIGVKNLINEVVAGKQTFKYNLEIIAKEQVAPQVWGSAFTVDWENPLGSTNMYNHLIKKGYSSNYDYNSTTTRQTIAGEYNLNSSYISACVKGTRTLGANAESYLVIYFNDSSYAANTAIPDLLSLAGTKGYECIQTSTPLIVVLNLLP
ncbi:MAG: hypothetical protein FWE53_03015 [Firmicutes bacterium]|nr:hypothetical protein [Bacillota bacterium]